MFSSITMASSTTNPTERIRAIMDRLSRLKSSRYITENVPTMENGSAMLGIAVAEALRRNRKITRITSASVTAMVDLNVAEGLADVLRAVAANAEVHRGRQLRLECRQSAA